jgi:hypothetical protein
MLMVLPLAKRCERLGDLLAPLALCGHLLTWACPLGLASNLPRHDETTLEVDRPPTKREQLAEPNAAEGCRGEYGSVRVVGRGCEERVDLGQLKNQTALTLLTNRGSYGGASVKGQR